MQRRQISDSRLSDATEATVRTAASRLEFPIMPGKEMSQGYMTAAPWADMVIAAQ